MKSTNRYNPLDITDKQAVLKKLREKTVMDTETGCWLWTGSTNGVGYGEIRIGAAPGKKYYVHRLSLYLFSEITLEDSLQANHKTICPNRNCWNWEHLYGGDQVENMKDARELGYKPGIGYNK